MISVNDFRSGKKIYVDDFLMELMPGFIRNKMEDLQTLSNACREDDAETVRKIGHNWKGVCPSYGFHDLGELGKRLETLAAEGNFAEVQQFLEVLPAYFGAVQVIARPESENDADLGHGPHGPV